MNIYAWKGMIAILILTFTPFLKESHRTKIEFIKAAITTLIVISISILGINYFLVLLLGIILLTLLDKRHIQKYV